MVFKLPATLLCDFYKVGHREQYPDRTERVYATWTPRSNKHHPSTDTVVAFGFQALIKEYLIDFFNENFFKRKLSDIIAEYERVIKYCLFVEEPNSDHIKALWGLGYLPIEIYALPEGTKVPMRVPMMTIENTVDRFFWITNYLESLLSTELWMPITVSTIACEYREILDKWCEKTGGDPEVVQFQGHDFAMRGMECLQGSVKSGMGHLLSFKGTDTIGAILAHEYFYGANIEKELVGCSIPATEHSVQSAGILSAEEDFENKGEWNGYSLESFRELF